MFNDEELSNLAIAVISKIADDQFQIEFWEKEIKNYHSKHDRKYLEDAKSVLKKDIDLKNKIQDELYSRKFKK